MAVPISPIVADQHPSLAWTMWMSRLDQTVEAQREVGPTSARPDQRSCYPGQQYFDTDLGHPVWAASVTTSGVTWVDATGGAV